ncbi:SAM hydrolase/SAM-dependent halogenase family protein [Myroides guanonis]|uniref:S-adenosyl-l-methionine hydroxide adenosyltransferase n=1 Tax=Myroides guanonis TaxID=1150112 RepID=A0A1I3TK82_9FLAO|nr:SAM-dependent chlorinase/fluorinase [Myroides guanonis]SFJ70031.1 hypothetical protein SAMN04487893_11371 [Myroides guanonis]
MHRIITLTTDLGYQDYFVGAIKGKIRSKGIENEVIDISHGVSFYNIEEAGFVVSAAYKHFPKGTIHIVAVSCEITESTKPILVLFDGHYFVSADNGTLSFLFKEPDRAQVVYLHHENFEESIDVFINAVKQLNQGKELEEVGVLTDKITQFSGVNLTISSDRRVIRGNVIYEDHFGNAITNISKSIFEDIRNGRNFEIKVKNRFIKKINKYFSDFNTSESVSINDKVGDLLAIFNDLDYLQISIFHSSPNGPGSPKSLIGLELRDSITIEFEDKPDEIIL